MKNTIVIGLIIAGVGMASCGGPPGQSANTGDGSPQDASNEEQNRVPVELTEVRLSDFAITAEYAGYLNPRERVELKAEVEGVVEQVSFEEGKTVQQGAVLLKIATEELQVQRNQAKSDLTLADAELKRAEQLAAKSLIASADLDVARNRRTAAFNALASAEIKLRQSIVKAPLTGLVKTRAVSYGEYLTKGQLIGEILAVSRLRARIPVPEAEIRFFSPDKPVRVRLDALPDETLPGTVVTVGAEADQESRTFLVDVELDNTQGRLRAGMLARISADLYSVAQGILVPRHAVVEREHGRVVFVLENNAARQRSVKTGPAVGDRVQVLEGLHARDLVVVAGQQRLVDGESILALNRIQ